MRAIKVAIVEDHALTRIGLRTALAAQASIEVIGEAADGVAGLDLVLRERPDVAIVDIGLSGIDGIEVTRQVRDASPQTRIVILTMHDLEDEVMAALAAGADAYCLKTSHADRLIAAVEIAAAGGAYFDPSIAGIVLRTFTGKPAGGVTSPLTPRETEVIRAISRGRSNAEIATELHLGLGTVKGHIRDILEKLAATDRAHAAVTAIRRGLI